MDRNFALQHATFGPLKGLMQGFLMFKELGTLFTRGKCEQTPKYSFSIIHIGFAWKEDMKQGKPCIEHKNTKLPE